MNSNGIGTRCDIDRAMPQAERWHKGAIRPTPRRHPGPVPGSTGRRNPMEVFGRFACGMVDPGTGAGATKFSSLPPKPAQPRY